MPRLELGLKARFVGACLLLVSVSTAGYYLAVAQFVEFLEAELRDVTLLGELDEFARAYRRDPEVRGPQAAGLSSYVLPAGADQGGLPEKLRALDPGMHDDIYLDGREFAVGREDVNGARLYVLLDMDPIERLEARFVVLAWICVLTSWLAAVLLALWLAQKVLRPVSELAALVGDLQPGDYKRRLSTQFDDREIGAIAAAFDRFMERMEAFVTREQAFTEDAAHELRTPLSVIDSAAQLLAADAQLPAASRERVQRILRAAQQIQMQMEALLFLAREDGGYPSEELSLHQVVADTADGLRELIGARPIELVVSAQPTVLRAPRGMAVCVVSNLLLNAIRHSERGRIEVHVDPRRLLVQDSGIGIPPPDLEHIFERRFRGPQSAGQGLGLYIVKRICDRLGWSVSVSSAPGAGTRVELLFRPV